jgi:hypothetical protein
MMPAATMRVPKTVTTEMAAAMMTSSVTTTMTASVPTAMAATALAQSRASQHAGQRHHGDSNDRSQHRILPQSRAIKASEVYGIGTGRAAESSATATQQARATPPARSCRD